MVLFLLMKLIKLPVERQAAIPMSREGVQRDILPIVEGTTVMTKYGPVKTDYICLLLRRIPCIKGFGFNSELQGRFPVRVELEALTQEDFRRILTQPENAIIKQQIALLKVENVDLEFAEDAIDEIAGIAYIMNQTGENIGARRLYTVMEKLMEDISYNTDKLAGQKMVIDREYVRKCFTGYIKAKRPAQVYSLVAMAIMRCKNYISSRECPGNVK